MLNYLLDLNISPEEIYDINHTLNEDVITSLELSKSIVIETLNYYKELGITNLSNIIINRPDLVLIKKDDVKESVSKMDKELFISLINNDIEDLILFGI